LALSRPVWVGTMLAEDGAHSEHLLAFDRSTILSLAAILLLALLETLTSMSTNPSLGAGNR